MKTDLKSLRKKLKLHRMRVFFERLCLPIYREWFYFSHWFPRALSERKILKSINYEKYFSEGTHSNYDTQWVIGGYPDLLIQNMYLAPRINRMKELFGPDLKGKKLLELGCSSGMFLSFAQHEGLKVHGLDISKLAVEEAKMATHAEAYPCDLSKENIPFAKDQFDIVVAFDLVEHIRDLAHLFSEVQRVLRPGGFFYFITPNGLQPADRDETHYSLKEQAEWEKLTKKYFELISSKTYNYYPPTPYLWIQKVIHQMNRWSGMKIQQVVVVGRKRGK